MLRFVSCCRSSVVCSCQSPRCPQEVLAIFDGRQVSVSFLPARCKMLRRFSGLCNARNSYFPKRDTVDKHHAQLRTFKTKCLGFLTNNLQTDMPLSFSGCHKLLKRVLTKNINHVPNSFQQIRSFSLGSHKLRAESVMNVFDRKAKRLQRDRTTLLEDYEVYDYLKEEVGFRLADRICDVKREFSVAVELGCGRGYVSRHVTSDVVKKVLQCEMSEKLLSKVPADVPTHRIVTDEEFLPFKDNSLDLVVSSLSLHWVNDLPGCFRQIHNALKSDGVLLGTMFGGDTLYQLRGALQLAEIEREGGFGAHISPFTEIRDLGNLLNRAGFTMLTIDVDELNITYPTMFELMTDLKGMGENNCAFSRKLHLHRDTMIAAASIYQDMYGTDRGVPATFQILYFIGWKPGKNQTKAAERGSATVSFKDLDRLNQLVKEVGKVGGERSAGEKLDKFAEELRNKGDKPDSTR